MSKKIFLLVVLIALIHKSQSKFFFNNKSFNCTTSGITIDKNVSCLLAPHKEYKKVMGIALSATFVKPMYEFHLKLVVENKQFTKDFVKIFTYKLDGCGFLNGTVKDAFTQKAIDEIVASNKELAAIIHKCPYTGDLKASAVVEVSNMYKSFIKGEYRVIAKIFNDEDKNIATMTLQSEGVTV